MSIEGSPSNYIRLKRQRYFLLGEICSNEECQEKIFPPRDICPDCGHEAHEEFQFSGKGSVYSFTTVMNPPAGFEENAPYTVAIINLDEGPLLTAQLTDLGDTPVEIGMPVEMVTRKLKSEGDQGMLIYGYKFRPILREAA